MDIVEAVGCRLGTLANCRSSDQDVERLNQALNFCAEVLNRTGIARAEVSEATVGTGFCPVSFVCGSCTLNTFLYRSNKVAAIRRVVVEEGSFPRMIYLSDETDKQWALVLHGQEISYFAFGGESAKGLARSLLLIITEILGVKLTPRISHEVSLLLS